MAEYVKKRTPVEAWKIGSNDEPDWITEAVQSGALWSQSGKDSDPKTLDLTSQTWLETGTGAQPVENGDWIVRKQDGHMYVMADEDFTSLFEEK